MAASFGWYVDDVNVYACEGTPTAVTLSSVSAGNDLPVPIAPAIPLAALPLASGLALAVVAALKRKR